MSESNKYLVCLHKILIFSFEKECINYLLYKSLSVFMVLMSITNKLPQILYMYKSKEIKGLSNLSIYLDIFYVLCTALYPFHMGYSFLDYGEAVIVLIENIIIFFLFWKYNKSESSDKRNISFCILICSFSFLCYKDIFDGKYWKIIGNASTLFSMGSKMTQILKSCKVKSTGPLSTLTFGLNMIGNLVRIFTNIKSTKDPILIGRFTISLVLNFIIFIQIIYYNMNKKEIKEENKIKEEKEKNNISNNKTIQHKKKD